MATSARALDPRTPVLVGVGQRNQRVDRGEPTLEPVDLIVEAARVAAADTSAHRDVLAGVDSVRVVSLLSWRYRDPGALVAERIGASARQTALTAMGGNSPQSLVNRTCLDIQAGRNDLVLLGGAEAWRSRMSTRAQGGELGWTTQADDVAPAEVLGTELHMSHPGELARGVAMPVQVYPLFEQALRVKKGRTVDEQLEVASSLWSRFSEVAASNPNAWIQQAYSPEAIRTPSPDNRWIGFPYTKLMNSNNAVEQGAALLLCSVERAEALGIPRDRWVFPLAGTDAHDHYFVSEREDLASSPAIRLAGRSLFEISGLGVDDVAHVDLYSCFPSAVQIAADELGLSLDRQLTVTGGLSFAGGPWNNYVMHAIAAMADVLRGDPGTVGLCTANGGFITKHALGLYSTEPPAGPFAWAEPQADVDALPRRELSDAGGEIDVEAWTVMFNREGEPETGIAVGLLADGQRGWGTTQDATHLKTLLADDLAGRTVEVSPEGALGLRAQIGDV